MNKTTRQQLAHDTWQSCFSLLPPLIANNLLVLDDEGAFQKHGGRVDIVRRRILPKSKRPLRFWSSKWCFYELGVGMYDDSPLILGGVAFLQFSNQKVCSSGHYLQPVLEVLRAAEAKRPQDFKVDTLNSKGAQIAQLARRYRANPDQKSFPSDLAAKDLARLIEETLSKFESIQPP